MCIESWCGPRWAPVVHSHHPAKAVDRHTREGLVERNRELGTKCVGAGVLGLSVRAQHDFLALDHQRLAAGHPVVVQQE